MTTTFDRALLFLVTAFGADMDLLTKKAYAAVLADVPPSVLAAGVRRLVHEAASGRQFYPVPKPHDWLRTCQAEIKHLRAEALKALPECAVCDGTRWIPIMVDGVERLARCDCWRQRQQVADAAGKLLALPAAPEPGDPDGRV